MFQQSSWSFEEDQMLQSSIPSHVVMWPGNEDRVALTTKLRTILHTTNKARLSQNMTFISPRPAKWKVLRVIWVEGSPIDCGRYINLPAALSSSKNGLPWEKRDKRKKLGGVEAWTNNCENSWQGCFNNQVDRSKKIRCYNPQSQAMWSCGLGMRIE